MEGPQTGHQITPAVRLLKRLRAGGMGSLWLAHHAKLDTEVVVKFLSAGLCEDTTSRTRFLREAAAAARVRSPHVVQMLDHGVTDEGAPYLVMEYLEGEDLGRTLRRHGPASEEKVAAIIEQVARALHAAHQRGVVHRDVKPANIYLTDIGAKEPFVKLLDFGIAKATRLENLTVTGELIGTPLYMSPEQIEGSPIDFRTDLWSLGVVAFRALTGKHVFGGDTVSAVAYAVVHAPMPIPSQVHPGLSVAFDEWFARACARAPAERFESARELADELWRAVGRPEAASTSGRWLPASRKSDSTQAATGDAALPSTRRATWDPADAPTSTNGTDEALTRPTPPSTTQRTAGVPGPSAVGLERTGGSLRSSVSAVEPDRLRHRSKLVLLAVATLGAASLLLLVTVIGLRTTGPAVSETTSAAGSGQPAVPHGDAAVERDVPGETSSSGTASVAATDEADGGEHEATADGAKPGGATRPGAPARPGRPPSKPIADDEEDLGF